MSIFDRLRAPAPYRDPELGELKRSGRHWVGRIVLADHGELPLHLSGDRTRPDDASLRLARELPSRLGALMDPIRRALFEHYEPYRDADDELVVIPGPHAVWPHVSPQSVCIEPLSGIPTIEIAYETAWDIEHTVGARIQNWSLVELCGSV